MSWKSTDMPYFKFNEELSINHNLCIVKKNTYKGAARDLTFTAVPGRSGDLITDNNRYKNVKITYEVVALEASTKDIPAIARELKDWLLSKVGYFKLSDTYDPEFFRLASYADEFDLEQELSSMGRAKITFNCKPFKYWIYGQNEHTTTEKVLWLKNPYPFTALPYIRIKGNGDITLSLRDVKNGYSKQYHFKGVEEYIEIDSETMHAYKGSINENSKIYFMDFPQILPNCDGSLNVIEGDVDEITVIPRWRRL